MKLADWLHESRLTPEQLRRMLGVKSRTTITRYLTGDRVPAPKLLDAIYELTGGRVTLKDFLDAGPPRCAVAVAGADGEPALVFPWTRGAKAEAARATLNREPREGDGFTESIVRAMEVLGPRVRFTKRGVFLLDGRPSDARRVVEAANEVLRATGETEVAYPGLRRGSSHQ